MEIQFCVLEIIHLRPSRIAQKCTCCWDPKTITKWDGFAAWRHNNCFLVRKERMDIDMHRGFTEICQWGRLRSRWRVSNLPAAPPIFQLCVFCRYSRYSRSTRCRTLGKAYSVATLSFQNAIYKNSPKCKTAKKSSKQPQKRNRQSSIAINCNRLQSIKIVVADCNRLQLKPLF